MSQRKKLVSRLLLIASLISVATGVAVAVLWRSGKLQSFAQAQVIQLYVEKIQPKLPFQIEEAGVDTALENWRDFFSGKLRKISFVVRWNGWRLRLRGPLEWENGELRYDPIVTAEPVPSPGHRSPPILLKLKVKVLPDYSGIRALQADLESETTQFTWPLVGLTARQLKAHVEWNPNELLKFVASSPELNWSKPQDPGQDHAVNLQGLELAGTLRGQTDAELSWTLQGAETLWGKFYLDFPKQLLNGTLQASLNGQATGMDVLRSATLTSGSKAGRQDLTVRIDPERRKLSWKTSDLPLRDLTDRLGILGELSLTSGTFQLDGTALLPGAADFSLWSSPGFELDTKLRIQGLTLASKKKGVLFSNIRLELPFSWNRPFTAQLSSPLIAYKKFRAKLREFPIQITRKGRTFELGAPQGFPLDIEGIPIRFFGDKTRASLSFPESEASAFDVRTGLSLSETPLAGVLAKFCMPSDKVPAATVSIGFPEITFQNDLLEPTGRITLSLFGGNLYLDEIGYYDFTTPVPETDFSATWNGLSLAHLGEWLNFGEMDGEVTGYASGVTLQSWFPTQFDFRFELKRQNKGDIVFSPDAMKNTIRLFAGEGIDQLPGIANWLAFGWPSRLWGGYDIDYAGISAYSANGSILLETLDPVDRARKDIGKHFILYGDRFKMPLKSSRYPVVLDATGIGNFGHHVATVLGDLIAKKAKAQPNKESRHEEDECLPEEFSRHR